MYLLIYLSEKKNCAIILEMLGQEMHWKKNLQELNNLKKKAS